MLTARLHINPADKGIFYEIEGPAEELSKIELSAIEKMNTLVDDIASKFGMKDQRKTHDISGNSARLLTKAKSKERTDGSGDIEIAVPVASIKEILKLDERLRFPILWSFSNQQIMTVKDFLMACSKKGFGLSPSWLPSAGGNFKGRLVNEDKMFHEAGKIGNQAAWTLTDVGKLKIMKELEKLKGHTT